MTIPEKVCVDDADIEIGEGFHLVIHKPTGEVNPEDLLASDLAWTFTMIDYTSVSDGPEAVARLEVSEGASFHSLEIQLTSFLFNRFRIGANFRARPQVMETLARMYHAKGAL